MNDEFEVNSKFIWSGVIGIIVLLMLFFSIYFIGPGKRGVVLTFGAVGDIRNEGINFVIPLAQKIKIIDVQVQKRETTAAAASRDLQETASVIALNYHIDPEKVNVLYQKVGPEYKERVIDPTIQEVIKTITAKYIAVDLIQKRDHVSNETRKHLEEKLLAYNIIVDGFSIVNFEFSKAFTEAIEAKQTAEQLALKAKNDLLRVRTEAEQKVTAAEAEAKSLRLQKENVTPLLVKLRAIEKWDGSLPTVTGGAVPFIDINNLKE